MTKTNQIKRSYLPTMHIPPRLQGQMVEHSYGCDAEYIYHRTFDRSDRSDTWERVSIADVEDALGDDTSELNSWEPWNSEPPAETLVTWQAITVTE